MPLSSKEHEGNDGADGQQGAASFTSGSKKRLNSGCNIHHANGRALREEKRRKWLAKEERKSHRMTTSHDNNQRESWFQSNAHFAKFVTLQDLELLQEEDRSASVDDNTNLALLLQPYRDIQDNKKKHDHTEPATRYFIAEGTEAVRLLIQQQQQQQQLRQEVDISPIIKLVSVFIKTNAFFENPVNLKKDVEEAAQVNNETQQRPPFSVIIGSELVQTKVVGFPFCRGALACGIVPSWSDDEGWLWNYLKKNRRTHKVAMTENQLPRSPLRIVALDGVCDTANMGSVVRSASAFGMDALILSQDSCDIWYRKSVRVSMGHLCRVPPVRVASLAATIRRLQEELGVVAYAAVTTNANCVLEHMSQGDVSPAWCCVIGNEGSGISERVIEACTKRIKIGMDEGVDSLSIPVATGILLHGLKEREMR
jgi:tRNA(Leu) C34 or U34 (ribose-2'-O)-methylase TrmL